MKRFTKSDLRAVTNYWMRHYVNSTCSLCSLCGNTGKIDTRGSAMSTAGVDAGRLNFCICPNGQQARENYDDVPQLLAQLREDEQS